MFDLGWSKILILATVLLVVVPPKDLPALLRGLGKFVAQLRRQAEEFRTQFKEALKDTEFEQIHRDVQDIKRTAGDSVRDLTTTMESDFKPLESAFDLPNMPALSSEPVAASPMIPGPPTTESDTPAALNGHVAELAAPASGAAAAAAAAAVLNAPQSDVPPAQVLKPATSVAERARAESL